MKNPRPSNSTQRVEGQGFSLLELAVVVAVLGMLSSIAIPSILGIGKDSNVSEAKALLNSAAVDCLQSIRNGKSEVDTPPDPNIISDAKLETINYKIKGDGNCGNFTIEPYMNGESIAGKDDYLFTMGFEFKKGKLEKFAEPHARKREQSCINWAGPRCEIIDPVLAKKWEDYRKHINDIEIAKNTCNAEVQTLLKGPPLYTGMYRKWDPQGEANCGDDPPNISPTGCSTSSCNAIGFAKDGEPISGGAEGLQQILCLEWVQEKQDEGWTTPYPPFNPDKDPDNNCQGTEFWFIDGVDKGSEENFKNELCSTWKNENEARSRTSPDPIEAQTFVACNGQEYWFYKGVTYDTKTEFDAQYCSDNLELERQKGDIGARTVTGCPANKTYYFCNFDIYESEVDYKNCSCRNEKLEQSQQGQDGQFTTTESGASECGNYWLCKGDLYENQQAFDNDSRCAIACEIDPGPSQCQSSWYRRTLLDYGFNTCQGYCDCEANKGPRPESCP